jgi:hypothetical protein
MTRHISNGQVRVAEIAPGTSDPVIVNGLSPVTVFISPGGSAKVQYTTSPMGPDDDPDDAVWRDWDAGDVSVDTESVFDGKVTALRVVTVTGSDVYWEVVA